MKCSIPWIEKPSGKSKKRFMRNQWWYLPTGLHGTSRAAILGAPFRPPGDEDLRCDVQLSSLDRPQLKRVSIVLVVGVTCNKTGKHSLTLY